MFKAFVQGTGFYKISSVLAGVDASPLDCRKSLCEAEMSPSCSRTQSFSGAPLDCGTQGMCSEGDGIVSHLLDNSKKLVRRKILSLVYQLTPMRG